MSVRVQKWGWAPLPPLALRSEKENGISSPATLFPRQNYEKPKDEGGIAVKCRAKEERGGG